jgi:hypothetical protein
MTAEFREKLKSLQWSTKGFDTRDHKNYYDSEALEKTFGHDAKDRMMERTQGLGAGKVINGEHYHPDRKSGELVKTTAKEMDTVFLNAKSETWED